MRYASVCSGIEAATAAWHPLGWEAVWFSQYDPEHNYERNGPDFSSQVLEYHYPEVLNLGNMLKLINDDHTCLKQECSDTSEKQISISLSEEPPARRSVLPASERAYLTGVLTSPLSLSEFLQLSGQNTSYGKTYRECLLQTGGGDFACILSGFTGRDIAKQKFEKSGIIEGEFYSLAWRVLDSRHFGVPQRRRRVFIVGYIGKDWRPPVAVLFERDSLRRDLTPGRDKGKGATGNTDKGAGIDSSGRSNVWWDGGDKQEH